MYKQKSNIDIVRSYLNGERPFIQVGYSGNKHKYRAEGETWVDSGSVEWERRGGRNVRKTKSQGDTIRDAARQKCKCGLDVKWGTKSDRAFFGKTGLCEDCLINYETKLRVVGVYADYEKYKLLSNQISVLKEAREKIKDVMRYLYKNSNFKWELSTVSKYIDEDLVRLNNKKSKIEII
jgi:hypothetical protein